MKPKPWNWRGFLVATGAALLMPGILHADDGLGPLLHQVEKAAPRFRAAAAQAKAAEAAIRVARSRYWGSGEVFGQATHFNDDRLVSPISYPPVLSRSLFDKNAYGYGAKYVLPLDIDGRITATVHAGRFSSMAAHNRAEQTRLSLFSQAVSLYRGLQRLAGIRQAHQAHLKALEGHEKVTATAVRVGRIPAVELLRIRAAIKAVEGQLAGLAGDEERLRSALGALLNKTRYDVPVVAPKTHPSDEYLSRIKDALGQRRPDVRAARNHVEAEDELLKKAEREWLPQLFLEAEAVRNQGFTAKGANIWSVSGQMRWQFWDGGRRFANTDRERARKEAARHELQSALNRAKAELLSAKAAWRAASLQYEAAIAGLESAREAERIQSDRFRNGRISATDLLDAEAALARARANYTSALANWWLADDELHLAYGDPPAAY